MMDTDFHFHTSVQALTKAKIIQLLPDKTFTYAQKRSQAQMEEVLCNLPLGQCKLVKDGAHSKQVLREEIQKRAHLDASSILVQPHVSGSE
jgi:hypothetical protein